MSDSLWPHGLQHTRLPCSTLSPRVCSNSCSLSWWCHPTISSIVTPFCSCPQSFPASGAFPMSWLFASGGQSIGASVSASVHPVNIQGWFPLRLIGWISLLSKGLSRIFSSTKSINSLVLGLSMVQNSHPYRTTVKTIVLLDRPLPAKWCLCFFNTLSRFLIPFLPRSKCLLISWL